MEILCNFHAEVLLNIHSFDVIKTDRWMFCVPRGKVVVGRNGTFYFMTHSTPPWYSVHSCGDSGFPLLLSEWSFTICLTPYNHK